MRRRDVTQVVREFDTGTQGINWVRRSLEHGRSFSTAVLERVDLAHGFVLTLLPSDTDPKDALHFESGDFGRIRTGIAVAERLRVVAGSNASLVVEHEFASPGDPFLEKHPLDWFAAGSDICQWIRLDRSLEEIAAFMQRSSSGYPMNGFLIPEPESQMFRRGILDQERFLDLADFAVAIVVGAYDATGYLVWQPLRPSGKPTR
jgi:hypothetical protein